MVGRDMDALFPKVPTEPGRGRAEGRPADARGRLHRRLLRRPERRDRRARGARRRRSHRGRARRSSASTAGMRAAVEIDGRRLPAGLADTRRWPPGSASSRRTGASRGSSWTSRSSATSRSPRSSASGRCGLIPRGAERRFAKRLGDAPAAQVRPAHEPGLDALGRQPAEGRAREVARAQADAPDRRRADARHRRRHEGRGAPAALRPRRPGRRHADDLVASCPRCSAWPTASSCSSRAA